MGSYTSPICNLQRPSMHPVVRRSANYKPTLWRNDFIQSLRSDGYKKSEISNYNGQLKNNIISKIMNKESQLAAKLKMVDMLQRLGVAYHFSTEIEHVLEEIIMDDAIATLKNDFASSALLFRLMRTNCYHIPQDILLSTITMEDNMQNDINGLHSLYETTFLAFEGEKSLEDARVFSASRLKELTKTCVDQRVKTEVVHALEVPLHWRPPKLEARWFINQCHANVDMDLINFAKLDYNQVQLLHQGELVKLSRWWEEIGLKEKLHFARDRLVEIFFLATGIAPEPHNSDCREVFSKHGVILVTLDDVYDIYGTFDELLLFTEAIHRWDNIEATKELPEYMRNLYSVIFNTTKETASYVLTKYGWDASPILIKSWQDTCDSFLMEAKWFHNGYKPSLEEYLENGWVSSTGPLLLTHILTVLADRTTVQALNIQEKYPRLVEFCATIFRLSNDCASYHAEIERGDAPSSIVCYMEEHSCSEQDALKAIEKLIWETWKKINEYSFGHGRVALPQSFVNACVNLARMTLCIYNGGDGVSDPNKKIKGLIRNLLLDPISLD